MTSSGTYGFNPSAGECVLSAFERIKIRAPSLRVEHMRTAKMESNFLMAKFSNLQPNLWKVEQFSIPLIQGTATYTLTPQTVMVLDAWITTNAGTSNANDRYITPISRTEYASYSQKQTPGPPTTFWLDRLITPTITLWPVPDGNGPYEFNYFACLQMQDVGLTGGQTLDLPFLWLDAYVADLAWRLARVYATELEAQRKIDAKEAWETAAAQNIENVAFNLALGIGTYYRR